MYWRGIIIVSLLIITCSVIELHSHHTKLNVNVKKSWLTTAEFSKYLQLSFNVSRCINVHINGASETTITHLKNFLTIYPNTYILGYKRSECTGYLMISTTVTRLDFAIHSAYYQAKNPTTEILIIVDESFNESSVLSNPKSHGIGNIKVITPNGQWLLSENYLTPRVFKKIRSFEELKYDTSIANLQGRELEIAAYNDPPFVYSNIDKIVKGVRAESSIDSKKPKFDGINFKLLIMVVERLNATYMIQTLDVHYKYFGENSCLIRVFRDVTFKNLDMGITKVSLEWNITYIEMMMIPFRKISTMFLVPRPKLRTPSFWAPVTPFSPIVWISIVIMLIAQSLFVYTKARLLPTRVSKKFESFTITWLETMGRLLNTTAPKITPGFKITFQLWSLASILLLTAYSSNLASKLTSPSYEKRIDTLKDFIEANLTWGSDRHKLQDYNIHSKYNNPYRTKILSLHLWSRNESVRHERILKGNYAIIGRVIGNVFFPDHPVSTADLRGYRLMKQAMSSSYTMLLVRPELRDSVKKIMLSLSEYGFVDYHERDVILRHTNSAHHEIMIEREDKYEGPRVLSLKPLSMCFVFLILGLLISTIVFILGVRSFTGPQKSFFQVLVDIKKNREILNFRKEKKKRLIRRFNFKRRKFDRIVAIERY